MRNDGLWYSGYDDDVDGFFSNPESYTPGAVAYNWLRWRVSPEMPTDSLMDAAELLDEIYDYCCEYLVYGNSINLSFRYHLLSFKLQVIMDAEFRGMIREFISLIMPYTQYENKTQVVDNIIYPYLKYRDPDNFA